MDSAGFPLAPSVAVAIPPAIDAMPGCVVTRLIIDDSFSLVLCGIDREVTLRIDGAGELAEGTKRIPFDPDTDPSSVVALLDLLNCRVDHAALDVSGRLDLTVRSFVLSVMPNDHQVSWSVVGPEGTRACCIAEGRVVWE